MGGIWASSTIDCAVFKCPRLIRDDEVRIEVDGVAKALATGAGAVGVVEGKKPWLRFAVGAMAGSALEG